MSGDLCSVVANKNLGYIFWRAVISQKKGHLLRIMWPENGEKVWGRIVAFLPNIIFEGKTWMVLILDKKIINKKFFTMNEMDHNTLSLNCQLAII